MALAISPLPPLLPTREASAGASAHYGLGLMVVLALLSVAVVPLAVQLIGVVFGREYVVSPSAIVAVVSTPCSGDRGLAALSSTRGCGA